ncbi:Phenylacetyl-CoA ligase epaB [Penicillium diatomitis]|uniref:Phenylacetyl-CoA ligase epaB n=1 Tax=Penicillium diatomitis TaxID=2819901 RepID=A0A9X0BTU0_9EURO|nr:Phenylacetyl-CoA ligase epaB [Penicillium diatomitis]KAJ5483836.1 Phenylacetyl-CoA ligase epaB [Penicillium diatomitis]
MIFEPSERAQIPTTDLLSYIFDSPQYDQNKPIYVDAHRPTRSISCNQARHLIRQLIAGLRAAGLRRGDCVLIHSFNDINYSILVLAIIGAGGVFTGSNPGYTHAELAHHIRASDTKFLITEPEIMTPLLAAAKETGLPLENLWIFDNLHQSIPPGHKSWKELFNFGHEDWIRFNDLQSTQTTTAARLFSSGTTGLPKAVIITHYNLVAQHELTIAVDPRPYPVSRAVTVPIFHAAAAPTTHISTLKAGQPAYVLRRFDLQQYLETVEKYNVTDLLMVPPIAIAILMSPVATKRAFLRKSRMVICGAAPLDKDIQARFRSLLGKDVPFNQVWGMTETSCIATMFRYPECDDTGSVGRLIPNLEAKLIDEEGNNISEFGVCGELCVRGPTVTSGYYKNAKANADAFDADGWFKTGDIARCDVSTRKWYIVDRKKELIKVRGFQVAPAELEAVLLSHPQIVDAAVIGVTLPGANTELPRAYVVRRPGPQSQNLTEHAVQEHIAARLARFKALVGGVKFLASIPRNPSGKILKRVLREQAKQELGADQTQARL